VPETQQGESVATGPSTLNTALADDDDTPGPAPTPFGPEFEPSEDGDDDESGELFPATHELVLKDHTKVVSALALDPSGARVLSGAHDYDCKLWDFGGMDARCKPFKTWEPAGTYYVSVCAGTCMSAD
jgi:WD40 repeat protein